MEKINDILYSDRITIKLLTGRETLPISISTEICKKNKIFFSNNEVDEQFVTSIGNAKYSNTIIKQIITFLENKEVKTKNYS